MPDAHSPNHDGHSHDLLAHLRGTGRYAKAFAGAWGGGELAGLLGQWHDVGKLDPAWQAYLQDSTARPALRGRGPGHKLAGLSWQPRAG